MERKLMDKLTLAQKLPLLMVDYFVSNFEKCEKSHKVTINRFEIKEVGNLIHVTGYDEKGRAYSLMDTIVKTPRSELDGK